MCETKLTCEKAKKKYNGVYQESLSHVQKTFGAPTRIDPGRYGKILVYDYGGCYFYLQIQADGYVYRSDGGFQYGDAQIAKGTRSGAPPPTAAPSNERKWADRAEHELEEAARTGTDARANLEKLDKWKELYPITAFARERRDLYLINYGSDGRTQEAVSMAKDILSTEPNDAAALYTLAFFAPYRASHPVPREVLDEGESAARLLLTQDKDKFYALNKPLVEAVAFATLGWVDLVRGEPESAEQELKRSLSVNPATGDVAYWLGYAEAAQNKTEKIPEALFYFARAVTYDGQDAASADTRKAAQEYVEQAYVAYHGSEEGLAQVFQVAKRSPMPPSGFTIERRESRRESEPKRTASDERPQQGPKVVSSGTGFVVSRKQHVLTNYHVVEGCSSLFATVKEIETPAILVAADGDRDLAVLRIDSSNLVPLTFSDVSQAKLGQTVIAIGYPLRGLLAPSVNLTTGTVSSLAGLGNDNRRIQITAPVQPGNSGGPLLDDSGHVVGVVVSKLDSFFVAKVFGDLPQNVNFAIRGSIAQTFLREVGVEYFTAPSVAKKQITRIAEEAQDSVLSLACVQ